MSRRFFLKILIALGLGAYFPKLAQAEELHAPKENYEPLTGIKFLRQVVTRDSRVSRTLMWEADAAENFSVEYFLVGEDAAHFSEVTQNDLIFSCTLKNLKPASLYKFRIVSDGRATPWQNLFTAGDGNFQMLIFADSQCEHYEIWQRTAETSQKFFPDAQLFTVVGDLVDNGEADYQWRAFFNSAEKLLDGKIFAPVMGNHECYGVDWFNALPAGYLNRFALPENNSKNLGGYFYSFDFGAAHFFVLNTQFAELEKFHPNLQSAQEYFFRRDAANANRPWKIVFMHKDIYDYARDDFNDIAEKFLPLFDELEIDLVFTGHLHTYRNRGKIFARKKSSRGTTYILCGRAGDQKYVEPPSAIDDVTFENLREEPESFIVLDVSAAEINLTARTVDGKILDKERILK